MSSLANLLPRQRDRSDGYALCTEDNFWFRPAYTDGKCPLCGKAAPGGTPSAPFVTRLDRSLLLMITFAVLSVAMATFVLVMYYRAS